MNKVATVLLFVNFVTVLFPQPGYIHPDEFFQSSEVVAGDILGVAHDRVWEFNATSPIRNLVFPYLLTGPSLHLLRWMNSSNLAGLRISAVKVVMATRLPMAFVSLFGYFATGLLSKHFNANEYLSKVVWCSSYVTWVYFTRTFSNSVEASLFAVLLLLCVGNLPNVWVKPTTKQSQSLKDKKQKDQEGNKSKKEKNFSDDKKVKVQKGLGDSSTSGEQCEETVGDKIRHTECQSFMSSRTTAYLIGFVIISGFFNRPTFLLFACIPALYWFITTCFSSGGIMGKMISVALTGSLGMLSAFVLFVTADSLYYNPHFSDVIRTSIDKITETRFSFQTFLDSWNLVTSSLVITPWNFLEYNMKTENLAQHGLHPSYMHFLVNLPLLLGPLFFPFLAACLLSVIQISRRRPRDGPNSVWLVLMAVVPISGLSLFPHQEPRFLVPLLPILLVLSIKLVSHMAVGKKVFFVMWFIFNFTVNLVYGYMHQAAIIPALSIYQQKLASPKTVKMLKEARDNHAFFYKTYPPPRHLLLLEPGQDFFQVHDLAGAEVKDLVLQVKAIQRQRWLSNGRNHVFIFLPSTVSSRVTDLLTDNLKEYEAKLSITSVCPHLSVENLPRFKHFWSKKISFDDFLMDFCLNIVKIT